VSEKIFSVRYSYTRIARPLGWELYAIACNIYKIYPWQDICAPMYAHAELLDGSCKVNQPRQTEGGCRKQVIPQ